jgi:hypothetical protein
MFLLWEAVTLGAASLPLGEAARGIDPLRALQAASPTTSTLVDVFAGSAVATSFIGFVLSLTVRNKRGSPLPFASRAWNPGREEGEERVQSTKPSYRWQGDIG